MFLKYLLAIYNCGVSLSFLLILDCLSYQPSILLSLNLPTSASSVLGLQVYATMPGKTSSFINYPVLGILFYSNSPADIIYVFARETFEQHLLMHAWAFKLCHVHIREAPRHARVPRLQKAARENKCLGICRNLQGELVPSAPKHLKNKGM
jgi:hypothetical protein